MGRGIVIAVVIAAAAVAYLYVFERERLARMLDDTPLELPATTTEVYKWRDASGQWQITDVPPANGTPFETLRYRSNDNVMPLAPRDN